MARVTARERDVIEGRAVFYLRDPEELGASPADISLPALALLRTGEGGSRPVVAIQAERFEGTCTIGVRFLDGGNGVCLYEELEFISEDDARLVC